MTLRTRAQLNSDADTNLADNTTGDISPADVRQRVKDLADSALLAEDTGTSAGKVPVLDGTGKLDTSIIPAVAITSVFVVASQVAMLALTAQEGDVAVRTDQNKSYILSTNSPSTLADWKELLTPTDAVLSVAGLTGAISAAALRTALSLVIGTDVQAFDPQLSSLVRQNSQSAAYTLVLTDGGKHIYHPAADTTARIWTIPANASVAFPIGTVVTFDNDIGAGAITIAITSDTLVLVGAGTTGSRTLASGGQATAIKVASTRWRISGTGLT